MSNLDELLKLKELLDLGIITENDFKRKKVELFSDIKTENKNSDSIKKKEIIIGEGEKECLSCKCIIEKESESCNFCDYDFINKKTSEKLEYPKKTKNNLQKYISVFFLLLIFIFIGTWFFSSNNSEKIEVETPKEATTVYAKPTSSISKDSTSLDSVSKMVNSPAAESFQNSENSEGYDNGEQIDNFTRYNINCIKDLNTNYYWYIAPDRDFNFEEARLFSKNISERNLNWRIPTYNEIKSLYNSDYSAGEGFFNNDKYYPAKIHNVFNSIGSGSWFWVSDENSNSSKAYAINLHEGVKVNFDKNSKFPVHLLLISN